ncbi:MGT family glycosyltransferase [Mycobacterium frederiksbergense]|uniref:MGT family glycosyltransferase n=1 Tax=Mycolicibacterium frederiksbergense TaxID=117567 RepID=A0ABT6L748_9MYCO|nr:macrolide family glycosyltransferase [Mycolicibacterium frederiksbergense]MDH6198175.1 MGT family glycosyltransferase [Mycolicibacterium frederiksbergense]
MHISVVAGSAPSHIYPHLAVIRELIARGHRVSYLVGGHLTDLVRPTGAEIIACTSVLPGAPGAPESFDDTDPVAGMRIFLDEAIHVLPQVHAALDTDRPDLVLYDIGGMAGPVAADHWGVPSAQLSPCEVAWDGYHDDMAEILGPILNSPSGLAYRQTFDDWLTDTRSGLTFDEVTGAPRRCLVLIPRVMQRHADRVGDRYRFVGPCIDPRREDPGDWTPPAGDGPLALLAFGTAYTDRADVYRNVIEALDGEGWRLVLAAGRADTEDLGAIPPWVQLRDTVPQPAVLQHADGFITHAGMGSCTEGLWFGVPMVAIPQAVDQPANAVQLEAIGVGRHLPDHLPSATDIRAAVLGVAADQRIRLQLNAIRNEIHAHGGPAHAADAVEDVAAARW